MTRLSDYKFLLPFAPAILLVLFFPDCARMAPPPMGILPPGVEINENGVLKPKSVAAVKDRITEWNYDQGVVTYQYATIKDVPHTLDGVEENINKRQYNSVSYDTVDGKTITQFYTAPTFGKLNGEWYEIKVATSSVEEFEQATGKQVISRSWFFPEVWAATLTATSSNMDGEAYRTQAGSTWLNTTQGTGSASINSQVYWDCLGTATAGAGPWGNYRCSLPFDTSGIPSNATVTTATLKLYFNQIYDEGGGEKMGVVVSTTIAVAGALTAADYLRISLTSTPKIAVERTLASISNVAYESFVFSSTTLSYIKRSGEAGTCDGGTLGLSCIGLRVSNDYNVVAPNTASGVTVFSSYSAFSNTFPYLEVEYSVPTSSPTGTITTPSTTLSFQFFAERYEDPIKWITGSLLFFSLFVMMLKALAQVKNFRP